ncbi:hypothetical protein C2G38_2200804 [Gigaspora rosea]|uniref:Uncharacterized protein n=1 Tax=Gigaspora rosea TaxID=44941 RepID=A0A397US09_9GLOM|nr:hypothetical protein C2G38_2200804 [Gigaspora rosea]
MPFREMSPPEEMNEREYIRCLIENNCNFCGFKNRVTRIYWERRIHEQYQFYNQHEIAERRREDVLSRENLRSQRIQGISDKLD